MRNCKRWLAVMLATAMTVTSLQWGSVPVFAAQDELLADEVLLREDVLLEDASEITEDVPAEVPVIDDTSVLEHETVDEEDAVAEELKEEPSVTEDALETENEDLVESDYEVIENDGTSDYIASGKYKNVTWSIDRDGLLSVSGTGEFRNAVRKEGTKAYSVLDPNPWKNYRNYIKKAKVDLKGAVHLRAMFSGCTYLEEVDLTGLDFSTVIDTADMFVSCSSLKKVDLSDKDLSNIDNMGYMFGRCTSLTEVNFGDDAVVGTDDCNYYSMFMNCSSLEELDISGLQGYVFDEYNEYSDFGLSGLFSLKEITLPEMKNVWLKFPFGSYWRVEGYEEEFDTIDWEVDKGTICIRSSLGETKYYYGSCPDDDYYYWVAYDNVPERWAYKDEYGQWAYLFVDPDEYEDEEEGYEYIHQRSLGYYSWSINNENELSVEGTCGFDEPVNDDGWSSTPPWFYYADIIKTAKVRLKGGTSLRAAFMECNKLTSVDFEGSDTSKIKYLTGMFKDCSNLESVNLSGLNFSSVTSMNDMFNGCSSLENVNFGDIDTSNVEWMTWMFAGCSSLKSLDLSGLDTENVKNMRAMFKDCNSLESLDVSGFKMDNVFETAAMFSGCTSLEDLKLFTGYNSRSVECHEMFKDCRKLENIDLSGFIRNIYSCNDMFNGCASLKSVDLSGLSICEKGRSMDLYRNEQIYTTTYMFEGCDSLEYIKLNRNSTISDSEGRGYKGIYLPGHGHYPADGFRWVCNASGNAGDLINSDEWKEGISEIEYFKQKAVSMSIDGSKEFELTRGGEDTVSLDCKYDVKPAGMSPVVTGGAIVWSTSDKGIVDFDLNETQKVGEKEAKFTFRIRSANVNDGSAMITALFGDNADTLKAMVTLPLKISKTSTSLTVGDTERLYVSAVSSIKVKKTEWKSADTDCVTVDEATGLIEAIAETSEPVDVTVTVTDNDKTYEAVCKVTVKGKEKAVTPSANKTGEVVKGTKVTLTSATDDASIYYTLDGSEPSVYENAGKWVAGDGTFLYSYAVTINKNMTLKAVAVKEGFNKSEVAEFDYTVNRDWGDVTDYGIQSLFDDNAVNVPDGVWYVFRDEATYEYAYYMKAPESCLMTKTYTGSNITFNGDIQVYHGTTRLCENRDYTLVYSNNKAVAAYNKTVEKKGKVVKIGPKVTVKGAGNYSANEEFYFTIENADINKAVIISEKTVALEAGKKLNTVKPGVSFAGTKLKAGSDYDLKYYSEDFYTEFELEELAGLTVEKDAVYYIKIAAHEGGNFTGEKDEYVTVKAIDEDTSINMSNVSVTIPKQEWTGEYYDYTTLFDGTEGVKQATVKIKNKELIYNEDFTVQDGGFSDAGKYEIILEGINNYVGTRKATLEVVGIPANNVKIAYFNDKPEYSNGRVLLVDDLYKDDSIAFSNKYKSEIYEPLLYVVKKEKKGNKTVKYNYALINYEDYNVTFENTGATGKYKVVFKLKGQYSGTIEKKVTIKPFNVNNNSGSGRIYVNLQPVRYTQAGAVPKVNVYYSSYDVPSKLLKEGIDYSLSYKNNKKIADKSAKKAPTVTIKGIGNFTGSRTEKYTVLSNGLEGLTLDAADMVFKAKAGKFKVTPKIMDGSKKVSIGTNKDIEKLDKKDYRYYYGTSDSIIPDTAIVNAGEVIRVEVDVKAGPNSAYYSDEEGYPHSRTLVGYYKVIENGKDISRASIKVNTSLYYSNGEELTPPSTEDITVTLGSGKNKVTLSSTDFEVVSITGNKFLGNATITIKGKGAYGGSKKVKCKINKCSF